jgi:hypothetical protein
MECCRNGEICYEELEIIIGQTEEPEPCPTAFSWLLRAKESFHGIQHRGTMHWERD